MRVTCFIIGRASRKRQGPDGPVSADSRPRGRCYQSARTIGDLRYAGKNQHGRTYYCCWPQVGQLTFDAFIIGISAGPSMAGAAESIADFELFGLFGFARPGLPGPYTWFARRGRARILAKREERPWPPLEGPAWTAPASPQ